ncbi:DUF1896 family protein [Chitinophaga sp. Ak27]|uniref:DUF1896 family protein n=1 Tax=Chitinophaga sp. Ak27 TaxID=2726116 RepID=UPI00145F315E|nr:DUF1896 family protein [Chitinophaga sp. Ak27]NLU94856.1 hypothetical protein [Chitinophaga sp. Ak27]
MEKLLKEALQRYVAEYYPDMVQQFTADVPLSTYLEDRVTLVRPLMDELIAQGETAQQIVDACMQQIIKDLPPSKYQYLLMVLQEEFPDDYKNFKTAGVLRYKMIQLIGHCQQAFEDFDFDTQVPPDHRLEHRVIGEIAGYLIG